MTGPPQIRAPLVGFRAWRTDHDGVLVPWTMVGAPWQPGVNEARCLAGGPRHTVPGDNCTCGLYALARPDDRRLDPAAAAVGSIAAWGEIEVHATGFRAQYAAVTALARPLRVSARHHACLAAAAERFGVPLVERCELEAAGLEHGQPVAFDAIPRRGPAPAPTGPGLDRSGTRGIAVDDHVWAEIDDGELRLGVTAALAGEITICSAVRVEPPGPVRRRHDTLATIGAGAGALVVRAPVDLLVSASNPLLARDPDLVRTHPETHGWLVRASPLDWGRQAGEITWGRRAATVYRATIAHDAAREDPFGWQKPAWVARQPAARSAADALAILVAERERPRFADAAALREHVGRRIGAAFADPAVLASASRAGVLLELRLHDPEAELRIDLGSSPGGAAITLYTDCETADGFLAGRVDIAAALRSRRIQTPGPPNRVLVVASLIKELQRAYRAAR